MLLLQGVAAGACCSRRRRCLTPPAWPRAQGNICSCHEHVAVASRPPQQHGILVCEGVEAALVCGNVAHGNALQGVLCRSAGSVAYGNLDRGPGG